MSESKHTPGPWSLSRTEFLTNDGAAPVMAPDGPNDRKRVALVDCQTTYKRGRGHESICVERAANANLIAAAPDLLEIAKLLEGTPDDLALLAEIRKRARAAIAKATA